MFNRGGFNRIRFNVGEDEARFIDDFVVISGIIEGMIGENKPIDETVLIDGRILSNIEWSITVNEEADLLAEIGHEPIDFLVSISERVTLQGNIGASVHLGKDIPENVLVGGNINGSTHIGKMLYESVTVDGAVDSLTHAGKIIFLDGMNIDARIHGIVQVALRRYRTFFIDMDIPPGAEIRINSSNKTVMMLHGGQAIDIRPWYDGDWIKFDRNTVRLYVENEGLQMLLGDVIYNDAWV